MDASRTVTTIVSSPLLLVVIVMYGSDIFVTPNWELLRLKLHPLPLFWFCERHSFELVDSS